jgi:hypothetical protein
MTYMSRALSLVTLSAVLGTGIACSSEDGKDGDDDNGGTATGSQSGPEEALADHDCFLGLAPAGVSYTGYGCSGTSQSSTVSGIGPDSFSDIRMTLWMDFAAPPAVGVLELESLTIDIPNGDADTQSWEANVATCTATATDMAEDADMGWVYYQIEIECSEAAAPAEGNTAAPLPLGKFSVVTFFAS